MGSREEVQRLVTALHDCDLMTVAEIAGIAPHHGCGDRLALLETLFPRLSDHDDRSRLEDCANIIGSHPQLCEGARELIAEVRVQAQQEFGPYAIEQYPPDALLLGFLKEPSPQQSIAAQMGINLEGAPDPLLGLLFDGAGGRWLTPALPTKECFLAFYHKLMDCVFERTQYTVTPRHVGQRTFWGGLTTCSRCQGRGRMACPACKGSGWKAPEAVQEAMRLANYQQQRAMAAATDRDGKITYEDLGRILGPEAIGCPACRGEGGDACACHVLIDVPEGARNGWVCKFVDATGAFKGRGRIQLGP